LTEKDLPFRFFVVSSRMDKKNVYKSAKTHWESVPATVSGMLDGYTQVNSVDLSASNKFIRPFFEVGTIVAVD